MLILSSSLIFCFRFICFRPILFFRVWCISCDTLNFLQFCYDNASYNWSHAKHVENRFGKVTCIIKCIQSLNKHIFTVKFQMLDFKQSKIVSFNYYFFMENGFMKSQLRIDCVYNFVYSFLNNVINLKCILYYFEIHSSNLKT